MGHRGYNTLYINMLLRKGVIMSKYNDKSREYTVNYIKANYDEIKVRLPKGSKENIKAHIEKMGDKLPEEARTMQGFIRASINEKMLNDTL